MFKEIARQRELSREGSANIIREAQASQREAEINRYRPGGDKYRAGYRLVEQQNQIREQAQGIDTGISSQVSFTQQAETAARSRPGFYELSELGDLQTQRTLKGIEALNRGLALQGMPKIDIEAAAGGIIETQRQAAYRTPTVKDEQFYGTELAKWASRPIEKSAAYHNIGMRATGPVPENPFEMRGDLAVEFLKGGPNKPSERFSTVSGKMEPYLPGGQGLQETMWTVAVSVDKGRPVSKPVSYTDAVNVLSTTRGGLFTGEIGRPAARRDDTIRITRTVAGKATITEGAPAEKSLSNIYDVYSARKGEYETLSKQYEAGGRVDTNAYNKLVGMEKELKVLSFGKFGAEATAKDVRRLNQEMLPRPYVSTAPSKQSMFADTEKFVYTGLIGFDPRPTLKGIDESASRLTMRVLPNVPQKIQNAPSFDISDQSTYKTGMTPAARFFKGAYEGIREKPGTAAVSFGIGAAFGGGFTAFEGATAKLAKEQVARPVLAKAIKYSPEVVKYVGGGLYAYDVAQRTQLEPGKLGGVASTELAPFTGGAMAWGYRGQIASRAREGYGTIKETFREKPQFMTREISERNIGVVESPLMKSGEALEIQTKGYTEYYAREPWKDPLQTIVNRATGLKTESLIAKPKFMEPKLVGRSSITTTKAQVDIGRYGEDIFFGDKTRANLGEQYAKELETRTVMQSAAGQILGVSKVSGVRSRPMQAFATAKGTESGEFPAIVERGFRIARTEPYGYSSTFVGKAPSESMPAIFEKGIDISQRDFIRTERVAKLESVGDYVTKIDRAIIDPNKVMSLREESVARTFGDAWSDVGMIKSRQYPEGVSFERYGPATKEANRLIGTDKSIPNVMERLTIAKDLGVDVREFKPQTFEPYYPKPKRVPAPIPKVTLKQSEEGILTVGKVPKGEKPYGSIPSKSIMGGGFETKGGGGATLISGAISDKQVSLSTPSAASDTAMFYGGRGSYAGEEIQMFPSRMIAPLIAKEPSLFFRDTGIGSKSRREPTVSFTQIPKQFVGTAIAPYPVVKPGTDQIPQITQEPPATKVDLSIIRIPDISTTQMPDVVQTPVTEILIDQISLPRSASMQMSGGGQIFSMPYALTNRWDFPYPKTTKLTPPTAPFWWGGAGSGGGGPRRKRRSYELFLMGLDLGATNPMPKFNFGIGKSAFNIGGSGTKRSRPAVKKRRKR